MKNKYKQLCQEQRYQIQALLYAEKNQSEIAAILDVNKSTISRELSRNVGRRGRCAGIYVARLAQDKTLKRHKEKTKSILLTEELKIQAANWMRIEHLSPELIAVEWKCLGIKGVSHECLYQWIWHCKKSHHRKDLEHKDLYRYLRHGKRKRKRGNYKDSRGAITNRTSIEQRPEIINERKRIGDIEVDLMMGKDHKSALLVMTDRATLITKLDKLDGKDSTTVAKIINHCIARIGSSWVKTLTFAPEKNFPQNPQKKLRRF